MVNKEHTIAIYGLSCATQELLERMGNQYNIIGLLDGYRQDGMLYGKPVISMEQAIQGGATAIIIVARSSSRRIIVNRIRKDCEEHNIKLYDVYGNDLLEPVSANRLLNVDMGVGREELLKKIDQSEVVSFDIFDTLIMRTTLYPSDVFELVEHQVVCRYGESFDFCVKRQAAERELSQSGVPTICEIYEELKRQTGLEAGILREIQECEWQMEQQVLVPRYDMCEIFRYALEKQKQVYLVSDMYYPATQLASLLEQLDITGYEKLLVSCEYRETKEHGLFEVLKKEIGKRKCLHIGDNYDADIKGAERNGIAGVWVRSGIELFDAMPWAEKFGEFHSLTERVKLGRVISRMFNSPFSLEKGIAVVRRPQDLGYLFFAPILTDYTMWLYDKLEAGQKITVLFGARDGLLMKELLDRLLSQISDEKSSIRTVYFLTSRISSVAASLVDEKDIQRIAELDFNGSLGQLLERRFSLVETEIADEDYEIPVSAEAIYKYKDIILKRSQENRKRYQKYIEDLKLVGDKMVFFDFVSSGTCQAALERIMKLNMQGYYFIRVEDEWEEKKQLQIQPFYDKEADGYEGRLYEDYFVLENILTSCEPSLQGFDTEGKPVYVKEKRSEGEIEFIRQVHKGIIQYFEESLELLHLPDKGESKKCSEEILGLLHDVKIENDIFNQLVWEDGYFGREISIKELM